MRDLFLEISYKQQLKDKEKEIGYVKDSLREMKSELKELLKLKKCFTSNNDDFVSVLDVWEKELNQIFNTIERLSV